MHAFRIQKTNGKIEVGLRRLCWHNFWHIIGDEKHNAGIMEHNQEHNGQIFATISITSAVTATKSRAGETTPENK